MFWIKACPRCSGDLYVDNDQYGSFVSCLQCGLNREVCSQPGEPLLMASEPSTLPQWESSKRRSSSHGGHHFAKTLFFGEESPAQTVA